MNNNDDRFLAVVGPPRAPVVVKLNEYNGKKTVDFRRYFYADGQEDMLPTQKGVSFDRDGFALVKAALNDNSESIDSWLTSDSDHTLSTNARAVERLQSELRPYHTEPDSWKSPTFFHVAAHGGIDHLAMNSRHMLSQALEDLIGSVDSRTATHIKSLISGILISFYRSRMLFDGAREMNPSDIFETLELNWGIILSRYTEQIVSELKSNE